MADTKEPHARQDGPGRPFLPDHKKRRRQQLFLLPGTLERLGGAKRAARLLEELASPPSYGPEELIA